MKILIILRIRMETELVEKLKNGEIDLMSALSYTDERAETMLFSDQPMGEERYYLYADLENTDISPADLSTLDGKSIAMMEQSVQTTQFCEWEEKYNVQTKHVFDNAMRLMERDKPFYSDELYKQYIATQSAAILSSEEKKWLEQHGSIRLGYLKDDPGFSTTDSKSGELVGVINDYVDYGSAKGKYSFDVSPE